MCGFCRCQTKLSQTYGHCNFHAKRANKKEKKPDTRDYRILKLVLVEYPFLGEKILRGFSRYTVAIVC